MFFYCETEHKALIYILPLHVYKHFSQLCNQIHPLFVPLHYETFLHNDPIIKQLRYTKLRHRLIGFGQPRRDGVGVLGSFRNPEGLKYNYLLKYPLHLPISLLIVFKYLL